MTPKDNTKPRRLSFSDASARCGPLPRKPRRDAEARWATELAKLDRSWFRAFRRPRRAEIRSSIAESPAKAVATGKLIQQCQDDIERTTAHLAQLRIDTQISLPDGCHKLWSIAVSTFLDLSRCASIWDVTAERRKRAGEERSFATSVVDRSPTTIGSGHLDVIDVNVQPLVWRNQNGDDLYLYPTFLVVYRSRLRFAIITMDDLVLRFIPLRFTETEALPHDAQQVDWTWTYTNRNGTPDRRFANNPQIPVVIYGEIHLTSSTGLNEAFLFSNARAAATFFDALITLRSAFGIVDAT